jgi:hypothetical protein
MSSALALVAKHALKRVAPLRCVAGSGVFASNNRISVTRRRFASELAATDEHTDAANPPSASAVSKEEVHQEEFKRKRLSDVRQHVLFQVLFLVCIHVMDLLKTTHLRFLSF